MMQEQIVKVGMADLIVVNDGSTLRTTGLGSCVGVTLFDAKAKIAGMAHVMLPSSDIAKEGALNIAKYADTALPDMIERMRRMGANVQRLEAKLAGGAQMFAFAAQSETMRVGPRNVESCKQLLGRYSIPIKAEDTGGNYGRTIEFDSTSGILSIRSVPHGTKEM